MALQVGIVYSKVEDRQINKHIETSKIWENCEHPLDVQDKDLTGWFEYRIKFDATKPVQCLKIKKIK